MTSERLTSQILVRVTDAEKAAIELAAQACGRSTSAYVRDRVQGRSQLSRPVTAAAGELLAICHILLGMVPEHGDLIRAKARRVIAILQSSGEVER